MNEIRLLENRLVRLAAYVLRDPCSVSVLVMGNGISLILCSAIRIFGGAMLAVFGRRGKEQVSVTVTPRLRDSLEGALASLHHPATTSLDEDGAVALSLRGLFECVAAEYPAVARRAVREFLRIQHDDEVRLFGICLWEKCEAEAEDSGYCAEHMAEVDEFWASANEGLTTEELSQIEEEVDDWGKERELFEAEIRRRFSKRRVD